MRGSIFLCGFHQVLAVVCEKCRDAETQKAGSQHQTESDRLPLTVEGSRQSLSRQLTHHK